jgi:hypothetical protein
MTQSVPGPWVDHEAQQEAPWLTQDGIIKFIEFPVRKPALSRRAFHLYWQRHHSPHVMSTSAFSQFMRKYVTGHVYVRDEPELPAALQGVPHFEGVGQVWLNSLDDAGAWLGHPSYAELIAPDEANFIDPAGGGEVLIAREHRVYDTDPDLIETGMTKLHVLTQRAAHLGRADFAAAASRYATTLLATPALKQRLRRLVVSHRLADPYPDWLPPTGIDAVIEFWFDGREQLQQFLADPAYAADAPFERAGIFDTASLRAIVTRQYVVHDEFSFQPSSRSPRSFIWDV